MVAVVVAGTVASVIAEEAAVESVGLALEQGVIGAVLSFKANNAGLAFRVVIVLIANSEIHAYGSSAKNDNRH